VAGELVIEALAALQTIGRTDAGTTRLPWTPELEQAEAWFAEQAEGAGLRVERDPAGSLWACPSADPPWWGVGSHLDSVRQGGAWDGALGVAAAFEVARRSAKPVCVIAFSDEEGARFNTPTFGSRALVGRLAQDVLDRRDEDGVRLGDLVADPFAAREWLPRLRGFLELHIDQSREAAALGVPFTRVRELAPRRRLRFEVRGRADHAGTTPMDEREDALAAAARMIAEATEPHDGVRATATRIVVEPNALSTIPSHVTFWLDLRGGSGPHIPHGGVIESASDGVTFDPEVRAALGDAPEVTCWAGHDAGIVGERLPAGMLLVRNERGVSHAPEEHVELEDALAATDALHRAIEALA
jgi:beta-ureidopropionase / N-carbamoyl-L-amino-acid hydrolase